MSVRLKAEEWIRSERLCREFHLKFHKKNLPLKPGGKFEFDAVSEDGKIAAVISTSAAFTVNGKPAAAKRQKIYHDIYFLLQAEGSVRRISVFSEECMYKHFVGERDQKKRVPSVVEFFYADKMPPRLRAELEAAKKKASEKAKSRLK